MLEAHSYMGAPKLELLQTEHNIWSNMLTKKVNNSNEIMMQERINV